MSEGTAAAEFAALLRQLKGRSGLSYGVLGKRLHMSTSTLHRYCNGDAVPTDYAPVERLARLCKASPDELVELHRWWVLADGARGRRALRKRLSPPTLRPSCPTPRARWSRTVRAARTAGDASTAVPPPSPVPDWPPSSVSSCWP